MQQGLQALHPIHTVHPCQPPVSSGVVIINSELLEIMHQIISSIASKSTVLLLVVSLSGCVVAPREHVVREPPPPSEPVDVYVYPNNGQDEAQTDRDRYECHQWAVQQSHFDPSVTRTAEAPRVHVIAPPPGANTAAGAVTGAVLGAVVSGPRNAPGGALVGAVAGAMLGAAADQQQQDRVEYAQRQYNRDYSVQMRPAQDYRRAISACLQGRGYTVK